MSKLILTKTESIQLFLKTQYIHDLYSNPISNNAIQDYLNIDVDSDEEE